MDMNVLVKAPMGSGGLRRCVAVVLLVLALAVLGAPGVAWAASGSLDLGVEVKRPGLDVPASGGAGSLDLGVALEQPALSAGRDEATEGGVTTGSLDLGVALGYADYHQVSYVAMRPDGSERTTLATQRVAHGQTAEPPQAVACPEGTWADKWYAQDPSLHPDAGTADANPAETPVTQSTVFYCVWKEGYAVYFDANNGDVWQKTQGKVDGPASLSALPGRDEAVSWEDFPRATRPGYAFAGWRWSAGDADDGTGRKKLDASGSAIAAPGATGQMTIDEFKARTGQTLYAVWEVAPAVRVDLTDAKDETGGWERMHLWYWPGRGYTVERPRVDLELAKASIYGAGERVAELTELIHVNPQPGASQYFQGWGYSVQSDGALESTFLITCKKEGSGYAYVLADGALGKPFVDEAGNWVLAGTEDLGEDGYAGWKKAALMVVSGAARISVSAPFEVTFEHEGGRPYGLDELEWSSGDAPWIASQKFNFTNTGDTDVYISGVECVDVGASAILPGGRGGARIFSLYEDAGNPEGAYAGGSKTGQRAIRFGYDAVSGANKATASLLEPDNWIVLPLERPAGQSYSKQLFYGLNVKEAEFSRGAIAMGGSGGESYIAKVANVKYTYAVKS